MQDQRPAPRNPRGLEIAGGENSVAGSRDCDEELVKIDNSALPRLESKGRNAAGPTAAGEAGVSDGGCSCSVEHNSSWGDFEGFSETSDKSDTFSTLEMLERWAAPGTRESDADLNACGSNSCGCLQADSLTRMSETAAVSPNQASLSYENIFKLVFQEVPVQQMTEDICTLRHFLEKHNEENTSCKSVKKQLCSESQKLWRILQDEDSTSTSRCLWSKSHCQDNFLLVLGIDAAQKDLSGDKNHVLEDSNLKETEELTEVNGFNLNNCKALIQTKLSGSSAPRHSSLFMYNLFLKKTPSSGNMQYITIPRKKKLFTAWNLKMKFFNSDVC
uniref:Aftiphilin clathrin-binding box domain-containing protein n=1 Tax=Monodelphis domestica TaxID=13616 RepID=A0A5F8GL89_MONDO